MTYDPRKDPHPIEPILRDIGELTLVGSRAQLSPICATAVSDYDFYLSWPRCNKEAGCARPKGHIDACSHASERGQGAIVEVQILRDIVTALEKHGFTRLLSEGGPYGRDEQIEGIWRLRAQTAFGRDWPHVDVIVARTSVAAERLYVLQALRHSTRGGEMMRSLKGSLSWGVFWWACRTFKDAL